MNGKYAASRKGRNSGGQLLSLNETIKTMKQIDETIAAPGGRVIE
jgi:hypothetical protein